MRNYDFVVFDMDGTLLDSLSTHDAIFDFFFSRYYTDFPIREVMAKMHGASMAAIFNASGLDAGLVDQILSEIYAFYDSEECRPFYEPLEFVPGVREIISRLNDNGIPVALISNSMHSFVSNVVARNNMADVFDLVAGSAIKTQSKAENFQKLLAQEGMAPGQVLYVGDYEGDVLVSRECGIDCCILYTPIAWVRSTQSLLNDPGPDFIIKDIAHVATIAL